MMLKAQKEESNTVDAPLKINVVLEESRLTLRIAQNILNNYGLYLVLECGSRLQKGRKATCRGRVKLTTKGNLRCSVCGTKWVSDE